MAEIRIERADGVPMAVLRAAMVASFADYTVPLQPTQAAFAFLMRQRGLSAADSLVAFDGEKAVALWLVSVNGPAAYLITSGTLPEYRRRGLARRMGARCMEDLRARGVETFQTEVIVGNDRAAPLYAGLGMAQRRVLQCHTFEEGGIGHAGETAGIAAVQWHEIAPEVAHCRDWAPSWQNDDAAIVRCGNDTRCFAMRDADGLAGFAVSVPPQGVVAQIAVRPDRRGAGIGRALLGLLEQAQTEGPLRLLNAQAKDAGFARFMARMGGRETVRQHELFCRL